MDSTGTTPQEYTWSVTVPQVTGLINTRLSLASIDTTSPNPTTVSITPAAFYKCPGGIAGASGAEMSVLIATRYRMGWVGAMMNWVGGSSTITISSTSTMRNEC